MASQPRTVQEWCDYGAERVAFRDSVARQVEELTRHMSTVGVSSLTNTLQPPSEPLSAPSTSASGTVQSSGTERRSTFVDTPFLVTSLVDDLSSLPASDTPSLYIDLEGINLCRYGTISLLAIFNAPRNHVYLVDVEQLGMTAFTTPGTKLYSSRTLKTILESKIVPKVFFDVRNDSDALFALFGIDLNRIVDLQLMELAIRPEGFQSRTHLLGLGKAIMRDSPISRAEKSRCQKIKELGLSRFAPEKGGDYQVFLERPLSKAITEYCEQDVALLPGLYGVYRKTLDLPLMQKWRNLMLQESIRRAKESQKSDYVPNGRHKALGPWG